MKRAAAKAPRRASIIDVDDYPVKRLTAREFEIAQHLAAGRSNGQIAAALSISIKTVDTHRGHALVKLGLANNAELALFWGVVPMPRLEGEAVSRPCKRAAAYSALMANAPSGSRRDPVKRASVRQQPGDA